jgi:hypothetical protein
MKDIHLNVNSRAFLAWSALTRKERDALEAAIGRLATLPLGRWPQAGGVPLESEEPLYMVRVDDSLRAIVRPAPRGGPEVLDLVRHETLERFFNGAG